MRGMSLSVRAAVFAIVALVPACTQDRGAGGDPSSGRQGPSYARVAAQDDERSFTDRFAADMVQRYPDGACVYGGPRTVTCGDAQIAVDRVWNYCIDNADDCDAAVAEFADGMATALRERVVDSPATREQLRVVVRTREYGESFAGRADGAVLRPAIGDLVAIVVVDSPNTTRSYGSADGQTLGLTADAAYTLALANTLAELRDMPSDELACGRVVAVDRSYYESTRLLDPRLFGGATTTTRAPVLVAVPTYDSLLLTLDCGAASRTAFATVVSRAATDSTPPPSRTLFRVTAEGVTPVNP